MKALPLILAVSLLANAALITTVAVRSSGDTRAGGTDAASRSTGGSKTATGASGAGTANVTSRDLVAALNADDPAALRDLLRSAGFSDDLVRTLVQMRIWKRYEARYKALQPQPDPNKAWWKDDARQNGWFGNMTRAQREEMRAIQKEQRVEMERLLGPDKKNNMWGGWQDNRLGFLPDEKRKDLQQVQQDYQELISEVQQDMQGFQLPSDREKLKYLQDEQKRDMDALMTPEERTAYDLRMSQTAQNLRWQMTKFDATEDEYTKIFPLQKAFDEKFNNNDSYGNSNQRDQAYWKERNEADKQLKAQIKGVIGDERYNEYVRSQDGDYQQLQAAARRLELPSDTAARVYTMRDSVSANAKQIADNPNLSVDQKKQSLADLANTTRDQVRTTLGAEAADAYFKNNGMPWIKELEKGNTVSFNKEGNGWSTNSLNQPKKTPAPKP